MEAASRKYVFKKIDSWIRAKGQHVQLCLARFAWCRGRSVCLHWSRSAALQGELGGLRTASPPATPPALLYPPIYPAQRTESDL